MKKSGDFSRIQPLTNTFHLTRRQVVRGAAALAASSVLPGLGSLRCALAAPPSAGKNPQPKPTGPLTQASLTVTNSSAGAIDPAFMGFSYEKHSLSEPLFTGSNTDLIGLFKRLGPSVLRLGGNSVEKSVWKANKSGQTSGQIAPSDIDALAAFVKATGWRCLYGVNLEGAATGATTPALAAAEVAYAAKQLGSSLLGIEIGNECDLYRRHKADGDKWSFPQFLTVWEEFRKAILATTPDVAITGPASAGNVEDWTIPFGEKVTKKEITLLTQHYYRGNGQLPTSTAEFLISSDPRLVHELAELKAAAEKIGVPYRMAECNSFSHGGSNGISNSYASSLWVLDYLFDCAQGGASGVNFHGGGNGGGYTAIADDHGRVVEARPEYYGILLFTLAGQGALHATQLSSGSLNATAYAIKPASGGLNLVVVNKDLRQNLDLTAHLPHRVKSATLLAMTQRSPGATGPDLHAHAGVTIQGAGVSPDGAFSPSPAYTLATHGSEIKCYVPALSAALIQIA